MSEQGNSTGRPASGAPLRPLLAMAAALLAAGLAATTISSCQLRRPADDGPRPPASSRVVRVRLQDGLEEIALATGGPYRLAVGEHQVEVSPDPLPPTPVRRQGDEWIVGPRRMRGRLLRLETLQEDAFVQVAGRPYRGLLVLEGAADSPNRFHLANHVGLEAYLAGVLARELPGDWHLETFCAQAIAARTYVVFEMGHAGRGRGFDVYCDQRSQVYGGVADETAKSLEAVRRTRGRVLAWGPPGGQRVIKAYYSSCCGGGTNPAEGLEPQLETAPSLSGGVVCTDCAPSPRYRWGAVRVGKREIFQALAQCYRPVAALGGLATIRVNSETAWRRPQWLQVIGPNGTGVTLRADDLRLALLRAGEPAARGLYSMNCRIRDDGDAIIFEGGRGFGHGVGLCQYGAQGKALRGLKHAEILHAYYPGAKIMRLE